jgi:hypothetical protein
MPPRKRTFAATPTCNLHLHNAAAKPKTSCKSLNNAARHGAPQKHCPEAAASDHTLTPPCRHPTSPATGRRSSPPIQCLLRACEARGRERRACHRPRLHRLCPQVQAGGGLEEGVGEGEVGRRWLGLPSESPDLQHVILKLMIIAKKKS